MDFKEVQNCFFDYEEKRHKVLQETQAYFLKQKFQPYVWFDENHRLRIKHKYRRGLKDFLLNKNNFERTKYLKIAEDFAEENNLIIRFIYDFCETDRTLPEDVQTQWSTEIILEV